MVLMGAAVAAVLMTGAAAQYQVLSKTELESDSGRYTNVKIGKDGLPLVVYNDEASGCARVAHCEDIGCRRVERVCVDPQPNPDNARFIQMKMDAATGLPRMVYSEQAKLSEESKLKYVSCHDVRCSSYNLTILAKGTASTEPWYAAFDFDHTTSFPVVVYFNKGRGLELIACKDAYCRTSSPAVLLDRGQTGMYPSIQALTSGSWAITYYADPVPAYLICAAMPCATPAASGTLAQPKTGHHIGRYNYMVSTSNKSFAAMFVDETNGDLYFSACSVADSGVAVDCAATVLDSIGAGAYGVFPEMDVFPSLSPFPLMSYFNTSGPDTGCLKLATCGNPQCSAVAIEVLASGTAGYGRDSSIAYLRTANATYLYVSYLNYNGGADKKAMLLTMAPEHHLLPELL